MSAIRCLANPRALVGEGPAWDDRRRAVVGRHQAPRLFRYDPAGENAPGRCPSIGCAIALRENGGLIGAFMSGFKWIDPESGALTPIADPEPDRPGNRFNDGKCDRRGRLFAGTMDDDEIACTGTLYRLDPDLSIHVCTRRASLERPRLEPGRPPAVLHRFAAPDDLGLRLRPRARRDRQRADLRPHPRRCRRAGRPLRRCRGLRLERALGRLARHPLRARRPDRPGAGDAGAAAQLGAPSAGPISRRSTSPRRRSA